MRTTLVPHGAAPTGVGVVLDAGKIKLTSPCCGTLFYEGSGPHATNPAWTLTVFCGKCKLEWTALMFSTDAVLYHEVDPKHVQGQRHWLARAMGVDMDQLEVTVE